MASRQQFRSLIYKFLFIPVVFVLLRLWTSILNILYVYVGLEEKQVPFWLNETLIYLAVSLTNYVASHMNVHAPITSVQLESRYSKSDDAKILVAKPLQGPQMIDLFITQSNYRT